MLGFVRGVGGGGGGGGIHGVEGNCTATNMDN